MVIKIKAFDPEAMQLKQWTSALLTQWMEFLGTSQKQSVSCSEDTFHHLLLFSFPSL
jgi:hypothetical protein